MTPDDAASLATMGGAVMTSASPEPDLGEIGRFVDLVDDLCAFETSQRYIRGYGAFPADMPMPDPSFVKVLAWLKGLITNG